MKSQGFKQSDTYHYLYTKRVSNGSLLILILYVDDMLIFCHCKQDLANIKKKLSSEFYMKHL